MEDPAPTASSAAAAVSASSSDRAADGDSSMPKHNDDAHNGASAIGPDGDRRGKKEEDSAMEVENVSEPQQRTEDPADNKVGPSASNDDVTPLRGKDVSFDALTPQTQTQEKEKNYEVSINTNTTEVEVEVEALEPVRKSQRAKIPSARLIASNENDDYEKLTASASPNHGQKAKSSSSSSFKFASAEEYEKLTTTTAALLPSKRPAPAAQPTPKTTQELHDQIKNSTDKLFFIAYSHSQDPLINTADDNNNKNDENVENKKVKYNWYLVRVDLATCEELDDTKNCHKTGRYYVDFYTKASYDQGVLLAGNPLENGIPAAQMKPKRDSDSRYWLEWHEYYFDQDGGMVVGKPKEFLPNSKKAIHKRLVELSQRILDGGTDNDGEGEEQLASQCHPDYDRFTSWADVVNLMDEKTRLVGPFDFDDVIFDDDKSPPLKEEDLEEYIDNKGMKELYAANHSKLMVKDRVHLTRWQELSKALKGRDIEPPSVSVEKRRSKKRHRHSGDKKRAHDELDKGQQSLSMQFQGDKRAKEGHQRGAVCKECGKGATEMEPLLCFPGRTLQSPLYIHASCGRNNDHQAIVPGDEMKQTILSLVEATFDQTRRATSIVDGRSYYLLNELKDSLNQALERQMDSSQQHDGSSTSSASLSPAVAESHDTLEGVSETNFTIEEVESFPIAYAYHAKDPGGISEENAKIATLDSEVEHRRQMRRQSEEGSKKRKSSSTSSPKRSTSSHPTLDMRDKHIVPQPMENDFPGGWMQRRVPRLKKNNGADTRYYSPKLQFRFRSKPEVRKFLEALKGTGGDEALAIETYRG